MPPEEYELTLENESERMEHVGPEYAPGQACSSSEDVSIADVDHRVVRKLDLFLLPFLSLFFLVNSLDRSNVGNAETANFTKDCGLQPGDLNTAVALFFAFFVALQPVGAALGRRFGMVRFVPSCMIVWGFLTALHIFISHKWQLITIRILIGTLEAGFYPTTVAYLSSFYTRYEYAKRLGVFYGQYAVAGALGGILSYGLFSALPNESQTSPKDWKSWQVLFLLEGGLTVLIALIGFFWLPHSAETAWFLRPNERRWASERIYIDRRQLQEENKSVEFDVNDVEPSAENQTEPQSYSGEGARLLAKDGSSESRASNAVPELTNTKGLSRRDIVSAFTDWKVWYLLFFNILSAIPAAAFGVFLPLIVEGFGFSSISANLFTAPPFLTGAIVLWAFTWWSDRRKERFVPILWGLAILLVGLTGVVMLPNDASHLRYWALCLQMGGCFIASPLTIAWMTGNMEEPGKRSIVLGINGWGNLAGVSSSLLFSPKFAPTYETPFFITLSLVLLAFVGFMTFRWILVKINHERRHLLAHWTEEEVQAEFKSGHGPLLSRPLFRLPNQLESWLGLGDYDEGRRGDEKVTFIYGL